MNRQVTFFTDEGNFGNARGLIRIDTTKWSAEDWSRIIATTHSLTRKAIAMQIEQHYKEKKDNEHKTD